MINKNSKIFIAGHNGMIGSAIFRFFKKKNFKNLITVNRKYLDLRNQSEVASFFKKKKPQIVIIAAARVGGIKANSNFKAEFIYDNLSIQNNLIHYSFKNKLNPLLYF